MAQLLYLQPFDDVNKRVSRLAANISFVRTNLTPLAFTDLSSRLYTNALLGVYELRRHDTDGAGLLIEPAPQGRGAR
jgi:Fic family protein